MTSIIPKSLTSTATYRSSLVNYRGRDLLRQAISKYDGNLEARAWITISAAILLFTSGATLGAILQLFYPDTREVILTFVIVAAITMLLLGIGVTFYMDSITQRRAKFVDTLESYMDAQADVARHGDLEAH